MAVEAIHARVLSLQDRFLKGVDLAPLRDACLVTPMGAAERGHFLCYDTPQAASIHARLERAGIVTDVRGTWLRIGFGCYHTVAEIDHAAQAIVAVLA